MAGISRWSSCPCARIHACWDSAGYTILLVEQNFKFVQTMADRFYVMEHGRIVEHLRASELPEKAATLTPGPFRFDTHQAGKCLPCVALFKALGQANV